MSLTTELRNGELPELAALLKSQQVAKMDAVVPATAIRSVGGRLLIEGMGSEMPDTLEELEAGKRSAGWFEPGPIAVGQIAEALKIPAQYLRRCLATRPDIFDAQVNAWLHGFQGWIEDGTDDPVGGKVAPDGRRFLVRSFLDNEDGGPGFMRALLSPTFNPIDNLDPLVAFLEALAKVDPEAQIVTCNLSETRMTVRVASPTITAAAPKLMEGYRPVTEAWHPGGAHDFTPGAVHPTTGRRVGDIVSAGLRFSNSETGNGAFLLIPEITVWACTNGATRHEDKVRKVHLGAAMDTGIVEWSAETRQKNLELATSMTKDAVESYLNVGYLERVVADIERKAGVALPDPAGTVQVVAKQLSYSEDTARLVMDHFIKGGQGTAGGVFNAVTSVAQVVASADLATDLEDSAFQALDIAHRHAVGV